LGLPHRRATKKEKGKEDIKKSSSSTIFMLLSFSSCKRKANGLFFPFLPMALSSLWIPLILTHWSYHVHPSSCLTFGDFWCPEDSKEEVGHSFTGQKRAKAQSK